MLSDDEKPVLRTSRTQRKEKIDDDDEEKNDHDDELQEYLKRKEARQ